MSAGCNCGRKWTSLIEAHCSACHTHYTNVANFDRHLPARGACPEPSTRRDRHGQLVFKARTGPHGVTWGSAKERPVSLTPKHQGSPNTPPPVPVGALSVEPLRH